MNSLHIKQFIYQLGIPCVGIAPGQFPAPPPPARPCPLAAGQGAERYEPERLLSPCRSIIVMLFPYYVADPPTANLSLYCRSTDYHLLIRRYLQTVEAYLHQHYPSCRTLSVADTSPLADRYLAYLAGLGFIGDNDCFIHERYGSYCFIGSILTTLPLTPDTPLHRECYHCGACRHACPGHCFDGADYDYRLCKSYLTQKKGSLSLPEIEVLRKTPLIFGCDMCQAVCPHNAEIPETPLNDFKENRLCKSYLTQKKGSLSLPEIEVLRKTPLIFGCDMCQAVCPHNAEIPETPLNDFKENRIYTLSHEAIASLSNREFQRKYGNRAFAWRGKKILLRNMEYLRLPPSMPEQAHGYTQQQHADENRRTYNKRNE